MLVKTTKTPSGGGGGACLDYLCGKEEKEAQEAAEALEREITREGATLLAGDIDLTQQLINEAKERFSHSHTSGVLSFEEANIPESEKLAIMESFEKCLLPGLEADEYNILWVEHTDKGRLELNWVVPRIHTATDAHLQPYYDPVDRPRHKAWQEMINAKYGYSSPDEPEKRQTTTKTFRLPQEKAAIVAAIDELVTANAPKDREAVIELLNSVEGIEVVRQVKKSISIKAEGMGQNIRLKGAFYEQDYRGDRSEAERIRAAQREHEASRGQRLERISAEYGKLHSRAATSNRTKYDRITAAARKRTERTNPQTESRLQSAHDGVMVQPADTDGRVWGDRLPVRRSDRAITGNGQPSTMALAGERKSHQSRGGEAAKTATEQQIGAIFNGEHRKPNQSGDRGVGSRQERNLQFAADAARTNRNTAEANRQLAERIRERVIEYAKKIKQAAQERISKPRRSRNHGYGSANDRGGFSR